MTFSPHVLLQFGGPIGTTEIWSGGLRLATEPGTDGDNEQAAGWLADLSDDVAAWVSHTDSLLSSDVKLSYVKCNAIGPDGRYVDENNVNARYWESGMPQGTSGRNLPNQVACVVTLETAAARGRASKGRLFTPALSMGIDGATGFFEATHVARVMASMKTFLDNINNGPLIDLGAPQVNVYSALGDPGPHRPVTRISVDARPDVQRRRANQLDAPRISTALA